MAGYSASKAARSVDPVPEDSVPRACLSLRWLLLFISFWSLAALLGSGLT